MKLGQITRIFWNAFVHLVFWVKHLLRLRGSLLASVRAAHPRLLVKRLSIAGDILPPKLEGDVGYDLVVSEDVTIPPLPANPTRVYAGVAIKIPKGYFCHLYGRSSSATNLGLVVCTATIDNGFTGEMSILCWNLTAEPVKIIKGTRIGQAVFFPTSIFPIKWVDELPATSRGDKGFGSTGK